MKATKRGLIGRAAMVKEWLLEDGIPAHLCTLSDIGFSLTIETARPNLDALLERAFLAWEDVSMTRVCPGAGGRQFQVFFDKQEEGDF